jgi:hypothetical protein
MRRAKCIDDAARAAFVACRFAAGMTPEESRVVSKAVRRDLQAYWPPQTVEPLESVRIPGMDGELKRLRDDRAALLDALADATGESLTTLARLHCGQEAAA